jgi:hypothetical protein
MNCQHCGKHYASKSLTINIGPGFTQNMFGLVSGKIKCLALWTRAVIVIDEYMRLVNEIRFDVRRDKPRSLHFAIELALYERPVYHAALRQKLRELLIARNH